MNADNKLNFIQRINWMVKAFIAYILDIFVPLKAKRIMNIKMSRFISIETASPTRMFTENLIYEYIPWKTHKQEFGEIFICEFGCGDLRYLDLYDQVLGKSGYRYLGLEAPGFKLSEEAKRKLSSKVKFINHDLNSGVPIEVNQCNVFLSFSVLEHIDNLDIFINSYGKSQKSPSIHYHSVTTCKHKILGINHFRIVRKSTKHTVSCQTLVLCNVPNTHGSVHRDTEYVLLVRTRNETEHHSCVTFKILLGMSHC